MTLDSKSSGFDHSGNSTLRSFSALLYVLVYPLFPVGAEGFAGTDGAYRFAVGARPGRAVVLTPQCAPGELPEIVSAQVATGSNLRGSAAYRKHLIRVLVRRAVDELEGGAK